MTVVERHHRIRGASRRAYTLVELMIALSIFAFASTAMSTLMFSTYNTNRHVKGMADSTSQAELTLRRIIELTRSAIAVEHIEPLSGVFDPAYGLFITTPPDASNNCSVFNYCVVNNQLHEKVSINGTQTQDNIVVDNVATFLIARNGTTLPRIYDIEVDLQATPVPMTRKVTVTCRNLKT